MRRGRIRALLELVSVTGSDRMVLVVLALYADEDGKAWPSVAELAAVTHLGSATVRRALRRLEEADLIATTRSGGRQPNHYVVDPNHLDDCVGYIQPNHSDDWVATQSFPPTQSNGSANPITGDRQPNHADAVTSTDASRRDRREKEEEEPSPPSPAQSAAPTAPTEPPVARSAEYDNAARDRIAEIRRLHLGNAKRRPR